MTADDYRSRIAGALQGFMARQTDTPAPRLRISSAATVDSTCSHCGDLVGAALRRGCRVCPADHVSILCVCTAVVTWGDHADALTDTDRAELRQVAHKVGQMRAA